MNFALVGKSDRTIEVVELIEGAELQIDLAKKAQATKVRIINFDISREADTARHCTQKIKTQWSNITSILYPSQNTCKIESIPFNTMGNDIDPYANNVSEKTASHAKDGVSSNVAPAPTQESPKRRENVVDKGEVDDTTVFYNINKDKVGPLTPDVEKKLVRKNFWFLLGQTWWIAFLIHLDKSTLSQASTMGIFEDVDMTKKQYNDLFVVFYTGYLIALWPGAWISQRVGQKQFIVGSLLLWAILLGMHPLVKTGSQMIALRFILGMVRCVYTH